jgi:hypothetical protein
MSEKKEQELLILIRNASNRYDWLAYKKHFREYCNLRYDSGINYHDSDCEQPPCHNIDKI